MERLAGETDAGGLALVVNRIAHQGKAQSRHVHPDLVGTARLQAALHQGATLEMLQHRVMGAGLPAVVLDHGHFGALGGMTADGRIHRAVTVEIAHQQSPVFPLHGAGLELAHQIGLGLQGLGHHHEAGGVLVQAVHDAGPGHLGQLGRVMQQRVEQGATPVATARMHHQTGRLVDDEDGLILVHHREGDVFRCLGR